MLSASNMPCPPEDHNLPKHDQPTAVLLLPAFTIVENVTPSSVPELIRAFINTAPTTTTPLAVGSASPVQSAESASTPHSTENGLGNGSIEPDPCASAGQSPLSVPPPVSHPFTSRPCPHLALILLCSQKTRDARCGQSAPLLRREFERHLRHLGLYRDLQDDRPGGVGIYFISHVGGHKFAANVMVYRSEGLVRNISNEKNKQNGEASQGIWLGRVRPEDCEAIVKFTVLQGKVVKPERQLRGGFDRARSLVSW